MKYKIMQTGAGYYLALYSVEGAMWDTIKNREYQDTFTYHPAAVKVFNDIDSALIELENLALIHQDTKTIAEGTL